MILVSGSVLALTLAGVVIAFDATHLGDVFWDNINDKGGAIPQSAQPDYFTS